MFLENSTWVRYKSCMKHTPQLRLKNAERENCYPQKYILAVVFNAVIQKEKDVVFLLNGR